ncbi:MAG: hypothetical protein HY721_23955 [Planctomycetes bacterium]|nr:hypothetical protein [Planctomycetota bacterium]
MTFAVTWCFPNARLDERTGEWAALRRRTKLRRRYARRFESAGAVARDLAERWDWLHGQTRLWRDAWYDSTLPFWLLDRTFLNISTLATSTCFWFEDGRFYGWEGNYCCPGTCTHVWHYAQTAGRIFPEIERSVREMVDYGLAFHEDTGLIGYRAELHDTVAIDGQAGTILRAFREHQMSPDGAFLKRLWPRIRKSIEYLIRQDRNEDGLLEGGQANTLDAVWYGPIAWLSSLYVAALRAGEAMATESGDLDFAA